MTSPIDYTADVATPFQSALAGYQAGAAIRDDRMQQQQLQAAQAARQQMQVDMAAVANNPNATPKDYAALTLKYPAFKDQFKQANDMMSVEQRANTMKAGTMVYAALSNNQPSIAKKLLDDRAAAMRKAGDEQGARHAEAISSVVGVDPTFARNMLGLSLTASDEKFASNVSTLGGEQRASEQAPADLLAKRSDAVIKAAAAGTAPQKEQIELDKTNADILNTQSQITERSARLGLDRDKLTSEMQARAMELNQKFGELPSDARKNLNETAAQATASEQGAAQLLDLAKRLESSNATSGGAATVAEGWKRIMGSQDEVTALRQEYIRMRSQGVTKMLPPGPASDKDIEIAMSGFPSEKSNPAQLASFLRGMAKLQTYDAVLNNAKSEWFGQVQHLGSTKKDITIDGVKVPAGSTFNDFASKFVAKKAAQITGTSLVNSLAAKYGAASATPAPGVPGALRTAPEAGATGSF